MAKVPRNILKTFFERGDKPTALHFQSMIDSLAHLGEDRKYFGLRAYDAQREYLVDDTAIFGSTIYVCIQNTTGVFNPTAWQQVLAVGAVTFVGSWDPATNTPPLQNGVGSNGHYYVCSNAGNTTLDGESVWLPGDWAIFNGSVWQKISYSSVDDQTAAEVPFTPTGDITANNTQDAIAQLQSNTETKLSNKADIVTGTTNGNFPAFDSTGQMHDSGVGASDYLHKANTNSYTPTTDYNPATKRYVDLEASVKADKVSMPNNGNLAGLNGSGNLTDSGFKPSDFLSTDATASDITNIPSGDITASDVQSAIDQLDSNKLGIGTAGVQGRIVMYDAQAKASPASMDELKLAAGIDQVPNIDATNPANINQDPLHRFVSDAQITGWDSNAGNLNNHISDFNNPHNVTKDQIGLNNVQNIDTTTTLNIVDEASRRFVSDAQIMNWDSNGTNLNSHTSDFNNPHNVTKDQVGLGNVQNVDTTLAINIIDDTGRRFVTDAQILTWDTNSGSIGSHLADFNNPHQVTKSQIGLSNVPNTDATNPSNISQDATHRFVSDAQVSGWNANTSSLNAHVADSNNPHNVTKAQIGLGNVPNADATNPVNIHQDATHQFVTTDQITSWNATSSNLSSHTSNTSNPHQVTKSQVGLGNVPNTDATIPANISQDATHRFVTDTQISTWNAKQGSLGFTPLNTANNLSDVTSVSTSRNNLGLGDSATKNVGTSTGTVAAGDDARLSDARHHKLYAFQFTDASIGAVTTETAVFKATIRGNDMGPNGMIEVWTQWTVNNNGNAKTARIYFGDSLVKSVSLSGNDSGAVATRIMNRNDVRAQLVTPIETSSWLGTAGTFVPRTLAVDTRNDFVITVSGQKANTTNTMILNAVYIILYK